MFDFSIPVKTIASKVVKVTIENLDIHSIKQLYDFMPVFNGNSYVGTLRLDSFVDTIDSVEQIKSDSANIVNSKTDIGKTLPLLAEYGYIILVDKDLNYFIVTNSDIKKQPFRMYVFNQISRFEIWITDFIRSFFNYQDFDIRYYVSAKKAEETMIRYEENRVMNSYIDIYEEMDLIIKKEIFIKACFSQIESTIGLTKNMFNSYFNRVNKLRNDTVHSKGIADNRTLNDFMDIFKFIDTVSSLSIPSF